MTFDIATIEVELLHYFNKLGDTAKLEGWEKDSQWTIGINKFLATLGHRYGCTVHASRCPEADGPEWLYDHHWRLSEGNSEFIRIPLVMEIEWGFGNADLFEKVLDDFLKLVQARTDLRVMVFQGNAIDNITEDLISRAERFSLNQKGDRYLFVGWGWDTERIHCRSWTT
jgi:hypothetical protein